MDLELNDRVVIVTGGASGIGAATATLLIEEGARVAVFDLHTTTVSESDRLIGVPCDVRDESSVSAAIDAVVARWGRIDSVVSCAGISTLFGRSVESVTTVEWDEMMQVNVRGQWLPIKHALPHLRQQASAAIVIVASDSAMVAAPGDVVYCTSKGSALTFARALSVDLQVDGIRVNCVCPSIVDTPQSRRAMDKAEGFADADYPVNDPLDIARALALLISPVTRSVNGQAILADWGYTAMSSYPA